jgi:HSP20 family protein
VKFINYLYIGNYKIGIPVAIPLTDLEPVTKGEVHMVNIRAPWAFENLVHELDRITRDMDWAFGGPAVCSQSVSPALEVDDHTARLALDLPGVAEDDLAIELEDNRLKISASRSDLHQEEEEVLLRERTYGDFQRLYRLPWPVKEDGIEARFDHGVLSVRLDRAPESAPRRIEVKSA